MVEKRPTEAGLKKTEVIKNLEAKSRELDKVLNAFTKDAQAREKRIEKLEKAKG